MINVQLEKLLELVISISIIRWDYLNAYNGAQNYFY